MEWHDGEFCVTTERERISVDTVYRFLTSEAYWSKGIPRATVERSLDNSLCFSLFRGGDQIGFARVISDHATIAYLGDVFVLAEYRGRGLSKWLMKCVMSHPDLQGLRRWILLTGDAHGLYARSGFTPLAEPHRWMQRHDPTVYLPKD